MSLHPTARSFRRAAFGSAIAASIAATASLFPFAATAIELTDVTVKTDCRAAALDRIHDKRATFVIGWDLLCAQRQLKLVKAEEKASIARSRAADERSRAADERSRAADERSRAADERAQSVDTIEVCVVKLKEFRAANPEGFKRLGKITRETACVIAKRLPPSPIASGARPSAG